MTWTQALRCHDNLTVKTATKRLTGGELDKEMAQVLGRMEQDGERFHHAMQSDEQLEVYESFVSGIFC